MNPAELHTLTGAYAVHALSEAEREEFRRHLAQCEPCAQEVRELRATAARLGTAAAVTPAPEMKDRVLARIANVRQLPPDVAEPRPERYGRPERYPGPEGYGGSGRAERRRARTAPPRRGRRPRGRMTRFALAACLAAALVSGGLAARWYQEAQRSQQAAAAAERQAQRLSALLGADDAVSATTPISGGGTGMVVVSRSRDEVAFLAGGLPALPESKTYQLWFSEDGEMRSAGLLPTEPDQAGGAVLLTAGVRGATGIGLTVEPAGGSAQPTSEPLLLLDLPG